MDLDTTSGEVWYAMHDADCLSDFICLHRNPHGPHARKHAATNLNADAGLAHTTNIRVVLLGEATRGVRLGAVRHRCPVAPMGHVKARRQKRE